MSANDTTPEIYPARWCLELTDEFNPYEPEQEEIVRGGEELKSLLTDLQNSPTNEKVERFFKRGLELRLFTQRSQARTLERYRCRQICLTDLEARPGAYPCFGTEEEVRWRVEESRRKDDKLAQMIARMEEDQRSYGENENLLASLNALIAKRLAGEQEGEGEQDESEQEDESGEEDESEQEDESEPSVGRGWRSGNSDSLHMS